MKKLFIILVFTCAAQISFAQMVPGDKDDGLCVSQSMEALSSCLSSNGVYVQMIDNKNGTISISSDEKSSRGIIQSCIAQYNQSVSDCPEAPEVYYLKSNNGKKP